jgi:hypothetical protein
MSILIAPPHTHLDHGGLVLHVLGLLDGVHDRLQVVHVLHRLHVPAVPLVPLHPRPATHNTDQNVNPFQPHSMMPDTSSELHTGYGYDKAGHPGLVFPRQVLPPPSPGRRVADLAHVLAEGQVGVSVDGDAVVVIQHYELAEAQVPRQRARLPGHALLR